MRSLRRSLALAFSIVSLAACVGDAPSVGLNGATSPTDPGAKSPGGSDANTSPAASGDGGGGVRPSDGKIAQMSVGGHHTCARTTNNAAYCWGENREGELGDGTGTSSHLPVRVLLENVVEVAAGSDHSCAVTTAHELWCWGDGRRLGNTSARDALQPQKVNVANANHVATGFGFTCASTTTDDVYCFGTNNYGELGRGGSSSSEDTPATVKNRIGAIKSLHAAQSMMCAQTTAGDVYCWGQAAYEGRGSFYFNATPTRIAVNDVADYGVGVAHVCVLSSVGAVTCAGENGSGQLGDGQGGTSTSFIAPVGISAAAPAIALAAGDRHTCAILRDKTVQCWGDGSRAQLGNGDTKLKNVPTAVSSLTGMDHIVAGPDHTCAWDDAGKAFCWGYNESGECGDGTNVTALTPQRVRL